MANFFKKHENKLSAFALIFMLVIPFLLYMAAKQGSAIQIKVFLGLMMAMMLFVMKQG